MTAALVAVLTAHRLTTPVQCACGWRATDPGASTHEEHVAAHLAGLVHTVDLRRGSVLPVLLALDPTVGAVTALVEVVAWTANVDGPLTVFFRDRRGDLKEETP